MLAFRALGHEIPASFPEKLTVDKVRGLENKPFDWSRMVFLTEVLNTAKKNRRGHDPLFVALEEIITDQRTDDC